ncbi:Aste57867_19964 [Aphanomyces stellatus]|uniref:alpha-1,2-Mannosidase n=1 Tax=Aphanomyces stellatus TaxID=120398 RepID=A0A485LEK2_9STRA|nr:hypothetical protein As57867_019898 [Aphanomyces stellatus]VFT96661.1 Aste57867_19964 [Aphanomyces stellatus]
MAWAIFCLVGLHLFNPGWLSESNLYEATLTEHDQNPSLRNHLNKCYTRNRTKFYSKSPSIEYSGDQKRVVEAVVWAWSGYKKYAFGHDVLDTATMKGVAWLNHDIGLTLIDSLDTMFLLGMTNEFQESLLWVREVFPEKLQKGGVVSVFETTIRVLGGLLSAYHLSGERHVLDAAVTLADSLSQSFNTLSGIPLSLINLTDGVGHEQSTLAQIGTLQLEFKYLAQLTCNNNYRVYVEHIMNSLLQEMTQYYPDGLLPIQISDEGRIDSTSIISFGANGDSYYEYLLKQWIFSDKKDDKYKLAYEMAIKSMKEKMVRKAVGLSNLTILGDLSLNKDGTRSFEAKMQHLACFVPGMLALGFFHGMPIWHLELAKELMQTCFVMYDEMESGLAADEAYFQVENEKNVSPKHNARLKHNNPNYSPNYNAKDFLVPTQNENILRPEAVESLMILYRVTHDEMYRSWGRKILDAFELGCQIPEGGFSGVMEVHLKNPYHNDKVMESFFIAETLKYLFLLFSDDDILPLDEYVFNTEAHPFPIFRH